MSAQRVHTLSNAVLDQVTQRRQRQKREREREKKASAIKKQNKSAFVCAAYLQPKQQWTDIEFRCGIECPTQTSCNGM